MLKAICQTCRETFECTGNGCSRLEGKPKTKPAECYCVQCWIDSIKDITIKRDIQYRRMRNVQMKCNPSSIEYFDLAYTLRKI